MSQFVVDASVALGWAFADEETAYTRSILTRLVGETAVVPSLWPVEMTNALLMGQRRLRLTPSMVQVFVANLNSLPIIIDAETGIRALTDTRSIAEKHGLTAYDACYLELSLRLALPLATLDQQLKMAANSEGVILI
ncbi:ribonuclease VapC [Capsulimonas corticalis]|uniref:Ribonuclease VapC n=1 Tax=Capsulimonas corticalis TaxID=2219043 RepID=A0A402CU28_9BACT|nr:type II toxin-antitoxin system VapC family toxin [Capsulimonas corticalis]BDI28838.1 ribonuclease VapC [Capsulimonas corticalis]